LSVTKVPGKLVDSLPDDHHLRLSNGRRFRVPAHQLAPDITGDPSETLATERAHLAASRAALRAMREHAKSLSSDAAADWVSQQILQGLLDT
jgi:hypothetical protein